MPQIFKAKYTNGIEVVQDASGRLVVVTAQTETPAANTMPKDVVPDAKDLNEIPRDKSVGFQQTEPHEIEVYSTEYEFGKVNTDDNIVPRDKSGDGLGGPTVTYEPEKADGYSSGNADEYLQKYTPSQPPTAAGDPKNKATVASSSSLTKEALQQELLEAKRALQKSEIARERERVARKLVQAEVEKGLAKIGSEKEFEDRVASSMEQPTGVLNRALEWIRNMPSASSPNSTGAITQTAKNSQFGFAAGGGVTLQNLGSVANHIVQEAPTVGYDRTTALARQIQSYMKLGQMFPPNESE
jgi:hypothetical protein